MKRATYIVLGSALAVLLAPALYSSISGVTPPLDFAQSSQEEQIVDNSCVRNVLAAMNLPLGYSITRVETIDHGNGNAMVSVTVCPADTSRAPCFTVLDSVDTNAKSDCN